MAVRNSQPPQQAMMASPPAFTDYRDFVMAAPMVRISVLAFRLFTARCGSPVVFSEELIAAKLAKCVRETRPLPASLQAAIQAHRQQRQELTAADEPRAKCEEQRSTSQAPSFSWDEDALEVLGGLPSGTQLVEFVRYEPFKNAMKRSVVFSTLRHPTQSLLEGRPFILQMGVADPDVAARAAALVKDDVDGFDVNMGCPKKFSVSNGMGAKLMEEPERAAKVLSAIRTAIGPTMPFSFKTRVFEDVEDSVRQVSMCLATGAVHSVTLHARLRSQRSDTKPRTDLAAAVVARLRPLYPKIAFIFNGSLGCSGMDNAGDVGPVPGESWKGSSSMLSAAKALGFDGGLVARDCMWNPTVLLPAATGASTGGYTDDYPRVHRRLLQYHAVLGSPLSFAKYHLTRTFGQAKLQTKHPQLYRDLLQAKDMRSFALALGVEATTAAAWGRLHEAAGAPNDSMEEDAGAAVANLPRDSGAVVAPVAGVQRRERSPTTVAAAATQEKTPQPTAEPQHNR